MKGSFSSRTGGQVGSPCAPALLARKGGQMPKMPPPTGAGSKSVPVSTKITKKPA